MKKLRRVWKAFWTGFWVAWKELPPKSVNDLHMVLTCDTTQVTEQLEVVIRQLERIEMLKGKVDIERG